MSEIVEFRLPSGELDFEVEFASVEMDMIDSFCRLTGKTRQEVFAEAIARFLDKEERSEDIR